MRLQDLGTRKDLYMIDPSIIQEEPGWNVRSDGPDLAGHIQTLADSIREVGVQEPLTVYLRGEDVVLTNGHCRLAAVNRLRAEGVEIVAVPVRIEPKTSNDADRVLSMITRNSGRPLQPLELAEVCKRLLAFGWKVKTIAVKTGYSSSHISSLLDLCAVPSEIKGAVQRGEVSATLAAKTVRKEGPVKAQETIQAAKEKAAARGSVKARPRDFAPAPRDENEAIVDALIAAELLDPMDRDRALKVLAGRFALVS